MALFGNDPAAAVAPTPVTVDEERRRYALDQTIRVTPGGTPIGEVLKGATEIEAYLRGPTTETAT